MRSLETARTEQGARGYLRQLLPSLLSVPVIGRFIHIMAALYRAPEMRATIDGIARRQQDVASQMWLDLNDLRRTTASHGSLPPEVQNLLVSLPQALRQLHRAQQEFAGQSRAHAEQLLVQARAASEEQFVAHGQRLDSLAQGFDPISRHLDTLVQRSDALTQRSDALAQHSEALARRSDALAQGLATLATQLEGVRSRQEFVRRELMFEFRYGAGRAANVPGQRSNAPSTVQEIVATDKLEAARQAGLIKLNLGCGHIPLDGYLNVDLRKLPGVDIVSGVDTLPVEPGEAAEIMSAHLLEHFPQEQLVRELLPYWKSLLKRGGAFRAVVPDAEAMIAQFSANAISYDTLREVTYGAQDYDGDFHYNMFTADSLTKLLDAAGFSDVQVLAQGRPNGDCLEFEICALNGKE